MVSTEVGAALLWSGLNSVASIPVAALGGVDPAAVQYAVSMLGAGEPGDGLGNIRPVLDYNYWNANAVGYVKPYRFGGGAGEVTDAPTKDTDTRDPNTIDVIVGASQSHATVLNWRAGSPVAIPFLPLG